MIRCQWMWMAWLVVAFVLMACGREETSKTGDSEAFQTALAEADSLARSRHWKAAAVAYAKAEATGQEQGALPESVAYARAASEACTKPEITNSLGMRFVLIPPGPFMMGSDLDASVRDFDERLHEAIVERLFYIATTEVTQAQWLALMKHNPSQFQGDTLPVDSVTWHEAQRFAEALSTTEGPRYRLPSEVEWEHAARAGTTTPYVTGKILSTRHANVRGSRAAATHGSPATGLHDEAWRESTAPVASYKANAWGLYDVHGNLWEWVEDPYSAYGEPPQEDPPKRVLRGGAWNFSPDAARSAARFSLEPERSYDCNGFRLARDIDGGSF